MSGQSVSHTLRQFRRAKVTAEKSMQDSTGKLSAIRSLAADLMVHAGAIEGAAEAVRSARKAAERELREATQAMQPMAKAYDAAREIVQAKLNVKRPSASTFTTPDDLLLVCEELERDLEEHKEEEWAAVLLSTYSPLVEKAAKEQAEGSEALKIVQKAGLGREQAEASARPLFIRFRRVVRATFGRSSREYTELRDRKGFGRPEEDDPEPDDTTTFE